jgi:hypothetical protein
MNLGNIIAYLIVFAFFHVTIGTVIAGLIDIRYDISTDKFIFIVVFWPLTILYFIFVYIIKFLCMVFNLFTLPCKKIKQSIKLKETNKIEENKRKKELVNTVLKELKLR